MKPQPDTLSRDERAALRRLRELLKEQMRAQTAAPKPAAPDPQPSEDAKAE